MIVATKQSAPARKHLAAAWDAADVTLLLAAVGIAPWLRGSVRPAVQFWLGVVLLVGLIYRFSHWKSTDPTKIRLPASWWCAASGLTLAVVQLLPWPPSVLERVSPQAWAWRAAVAAPTGVTGDQSPAGVTAGESSPLSLAAPLTATMTAQLALCCATMMLAVGYLRSAKAVTAALALVTVNGAALAFIGLAEKLAGRGLLFWEPRKDWFGPFVNRNNGAGYLVMCFAAGLGLWLLLVTGQPSDRDGESGVRRVLRRITGPVIGATAALALIIAAIAASLSRGAVLALGAGAVAVLVSVFLQKGFRLAALAGALFLPAAIGLLGFVGVLDDVDRRLETLSDVPRLLQDGRVKNWEAGWKAAPQFLRAGSGLGTYRFAYRPFQDHPAEERFHYPENVFLQTLVEAGLPGLTLLLLGLGTAAGGVLRLCRSADSSRRILGLVGVFLLTSVSVQGCLDNGFYLPANMLLLATLLGLVCGSATQTAEAATEDLRYQPRSAWSDWSRASAGALMLVAVTWSLGELSAAAPGAEMLYKTRAFTDRMPLGHDELESDLVGLEQALRRRPNDVELRRRAAEAYISLYRLEAIDELRRTHPGAATAVLENVASLPVLFAAAARAEQGGDLSSLDALRLQPAVTRHLRPALTHLQLAVAATPADAESQLYLGELEFLIAAPSRSGARFDLVAELAKGRPSLLLRLGVDQLSLGRKPFGYAALRRAWLLDASTARPIIDAVTFYATWPEIVEHVVPATPGSSELLLKLLRQRRMTAKDLAIVEEEVKRLERASQSSSAEFFP
ncbi:MAG: O-antigen ligase family protein [Planctomycetaceae bacterium]|nr:O-antigen ligase family protein [Planctomycetaceae bacterium]